MMSIQGTRISTVTSFPDTNIFQSSEVRALHVKGSENKNLDSPSIKGCSIAQAQTLHKC